MLAFKDVQHLCGEFERKRVHERARETCSYPLRCLLLNVLRMPRTVSGCLVERLLVCDPPANNVSNVEAKALPYFNCNFGTIIRFKYPICFRQVDALRMNIHGNSEI